MYILCTLKNGRVLLHGMYLTSFMKTVPSVKTMIYSEYEYVYIHVFVAEGTAFRKHTVSDELLVIS